MNSSPFDLTQNVKNTCSKIDFDLELQNFSFFFFFLASYSTRHEDETFLKETIDRKSVGSLGGMAKKVS